MKLSLLTLAAGALVLATTAEASYVPPACAGSSVFSCSVTTGATSSEAGALTDTFDPGAAITLSRTGGHLYHASVSGITAQPPGSTGNFWSIGTSGVTAQNEQAGPGWIDLASMPASYYGFLWGSPDGYNTVKFFDGAQLLATFAGSDVFNPANGYQGALQNGQYFNFFAGGGYVITQVEFVSTQNAFETDNHAVIAANVPEPATLSLLGLGLVGLGLRRRRAPR